MALTFFWTLSAVIFLATTLVHFSTFLGFNPMQQWPGVMFLHIAVFVPFFAGFYFAGRASAYPRNPTSDVTRFAPRWLRRLPSAFFVYAILNFALFLYLMEFGSVRQIDGKPTLVTAFNTKRVLTQAEKSKFDTYIVRGFSGHWMAFASFGLLALTGACLARTASTRPRRGALLTQPSK